MKQRHDDARRREKHQRLAIGLKMQCELVTRPRRAASRLR